MLRAVLRRSLPLLIAAGMLGATAAPAAAKPPPGDWTFIRKDNFRHYACKSRTDDKGVWRIRTATFLNGNDEAIGYGIGAYAAIARGSNRNVVRQRTSTDWQGGYIHMNLGRARKGDRLWVQGAYYGPAEPWSDGFRVSRITRCDPR
jgi:hypothetical protein